MKGLVLNTTFTKQMKKMFSSNKAQEEKNIARAVIKDIELQNGETSVLRYIYTVNYSLIYYEHLFLDCYYSS